MWLSVQSFRDPGSFRLVASLSSWASESALFSQQMEKEKRKITLGRFLWVRPEAETFTSAHIPLAKLLPMAIPEAREAGMPSSCDLRRRKQVW